MCGLLANVSPTGDALTFAGSAKSLLEPRVVAYGREVVVPQRLFAESRQELDGPPEVAERLVARVARESREARVVVVEAGVVRRALEAGAHSIERVDVALLAVGTHRIAVERPRLAPVERLEGLTGRRTEGEDRSVPRRLSPCLRPNENESPRRRVDRLAVDLERRVPVQHDVQLLLTRAGLIVLADQRAVLAGREGVDSE